MNWESVADNRFLPKGVAISIPPALTRFAQFRLAIEPEPRQRVFTATPVAAPDLVVADVVKTRSTQITRDIDGNVSKITKVGGRAIDITRDVDGNVEELADGTRTWTVGRDVDGNVEEVTVV